MTMRLGYTPSKPYHSRGTNRVSHDLRGPTIPAMSPRTRTSFTIIRLVMDPWAIPRGTLGSPRPTHLHHHHSSPRRQLPPVPHPTSRTRCSHLLSALMHYGSRPRSTESSSHRIWRRFALMCVRCWLTRPLFFSRSSPSRLTCSAPRLPSSATATATTAVTQRSPGDFSSPSSVLLLPVETLDIFVRGGGGGGV